VRKPKAAENAAAKPDYALVGLVRKAQGVKGELLIEPLTDSPDVIFAPGSRVFGGDSRGNLDAASDTDEAGGEHHPPTLTVDTVRSHKGGLLIQFEELGDRNSAELWRGRYLLAPFSELPPLQEHEVYLHDLIGMDVEDSTGARRGTVETFYELPQGIMLDVNTGKGSVLIPYHPQSVQRADVERRTIVVDENSGLFD
jgi:16S rRNA processing protein RimM